MLNNAKLSVFLNWGNILNKKKSFIIEFQSYKIINTAVQLIKRKFLKNIFIGFA